MPFIDFENYRKGARADKGRNKLYKEGLRKEILHITPPPIIIAASI